MIGRNVVGYDRYFTGDDRKDGGNVLDRKDCEGRICYDVRHSWLIKLSDSAEFHGAYLGKDLGHDLERVESSRGPHAKGNVAGR